MTLEVIRPSTQECGVVCNPKRIACVPFCVRKHTGWRDPTYPVCTAFPCTGGVWIIDANRPFLFNAPAASLTALPFQRDIRQRFPDRPWPYEPPEVLLSFVAF